MVGQVQIRVSNNEAAVDEDPREQVQIRESKDEVAVAGWRRSSSNWTESEQQQLDGVGAATVTAEKEQRQWLAHQERPRESGSGEKDVG